MFIVITGGPSVGKSTVIRMLKDRGHTVVNEQATAVIQEGKVLPWLDRDGFQKEVLRRQLNEEKRVNREPPPVFVDRGAYDGEAYYLMDGLEPPEVFQTIQPERYLAVFLLEPLDTFELDGIRFENIEFTKKVTPILEACYAKRGILVERVEAMPPEQRMTKIIRTMETRLRLASQRS